LSFDKSLVLVLVLVGNSAVTMESSLKIIMSERGKELAVVSSHKYRFLRKRKDELLKWICYDKRCYASILTDVKKTQVYFRNRRTQTYEAITSQNIDRQVLRENCKRKASDSISTIDTKVLIYSLCVLLLYFIYLNILYCF